MPVTGPNRIPFLLTNKVDLLVASLAVTPERAKQVQFSQPYAAATIVLYGKTGTPIKSAADLKGVRVGVARASTQDVAVTKAAPEGTEIRRFDDDASAMQALMSGQDVDHVLQAITSRVVEVFEVDRCALFVPGPAGGLVHAAETVRGQSTEASDPAAARWVFEHGIEMDLQNGDGSQSGGGRLYVPVDCGSAPVCLVES